MEKLPVIQVMPNEKGEVIVRTGPAEQIFQKEPTIVDVKGAITVPAAWAAVRPPIKENGHVLYSRSKMYIKYVENEKDAYQAKVEGTLAFNPDLVEFHINEENELTPEALSQFLKMRRHLVVAQDDAAFSLLISNLKNFSAKIQTVREQNSDARGNMSLAVSKVVDAGRMPLEFTLDIPVFVGFGKRKFKVEICLETRDVALKVWLESPELKMIVGSERDSIIDKELEIFKTAGMPILELA